MTCAYLTCFTYQIFCSRLAKCCTSLIISDNSSYIFITGDPCTTSNCNNLFWSSTISYIDGSCTFIKSCNSSNILTVGTHNAAILRFCFSSNSNLTVISSGDSTDIIFCTGNICITGIISYNTFRQIPSNNSTQILTSGNRFSGCRATSFDRSCSIASCSITECNITSDIQSGNSSNVLQCRISKMFAKCTLINQAGIQSDNSTDSGKSRQTSFVRTIVDNLIFQINSNNSTN